MANKPTNLHYIMLGVFGPFVALVVLIALPLLYAFYWMGRGWAKVPIVRELLTEDDDKRTRSEQA